MNLYNVKKLVKRRGVTLMILQHEFGIYFLYFLNKSTFLYKALFMSHSYLGDVGGNVDSVSLKPSCSYYCSHCQLGIAMILSDSMWDL